MISAFSEDPRLLQGRSANPASPAVSASTAVIIDAQGSSPSNNVVTLSATVATSPLTEVSEAAKDEEDILVSLSPRERWRFIARRHPAQFVLSLFALVSATFTLAKVLSAIVLRGIVLVIGPAHAQVAAQSERILSFSGLGISLELMVTVVLSVSLLWSFGILSKTDHPKKIAISWDAIKILFGFFGGLLVGKG